MTGRIGHFESLPAIPSDHDLALVARAALGDANERAVAYLVDYAKASKRYLAGIDAVVSRARYVVRRANRETVTAADVRQAIQSSVIPSDSALVGALESTDKPPQKRAGNRVSEPFQAGQFAERSAAASKPFESLPTRGQLAEV